MKKTGVISNFIWRFAERCGAQLVTGIVSLLLARILAPADYGRIALVEVFMNILYVFVDCGLCTALIQKKETDELDFSSVFYFNLATCIVLYAIIFLAAPYIAAFYKDAELTAVVRVIGLMLIFAGLKGIQQVYVSRNMIFKLFFFSTLGGTVFSAVVGLWMAYSGFGVWALVAQQLANTAVDTLVLWLTVGWRPRKLFSWQRLKGLLSYGWKLLASSLLDTVYNNLRSLLIGRVYTSADLAYYNQGRILPDAIAVNVEEPLFESQTKIKLGSTNMAPGGPTVNKFVGDFVKTEVDNYLHKHTDVADVMLQKIQESEKERKAIAGVTKLARERAKKANLHNRKLRDCRFHLNDVKGDKKEESCIFITEGDSASGSITKSRDVNTQAVFSLRGKPLNSYGLTKKIVYENEEFNLLQAALNIEDGMEGLRYNKVIVATDADVDGMHIRLLLITFFLQFFPDLIKKGHVYILQTPLFRVRNRKKGVYETVYCYSEEERIAAIERLSPNPEITRFKGLGEISPDEFKHFIGKDMRLEQVSLRKTDLVKELLEFYMGKNTMERQNFIIDNLVIEEDIA